MELPASYGVSYKYSAFVSVTHAGVGFGDVAVFGLFLLLLISLAHK